MHGQDEWELNNGKLLITLGKWWEYGEERHYTTNTVKHALHKSLSTCKMHANNMPGQPCIKHANRALHANGMPSRANDTKVYKTEP